MKVQIPCTCPPKANGEPRHEHDTFVFRDKLNLEAGLSIRNAVTVVKLDDPGAGAAEVLAAMSVQYIVHGVSEWTRVDDKGKRVDLDKSVLRQFIEDHDEVVSEYLVDPADDLYRDRYLLPLMRRASASSQPSPTEQSTSAATGSEETPRKPSRRSSTTTTQTADITPITRRHAGDSSTSRRSA